MKGTLAVLGTLGGRPAAALVTDGALQELLVAQDPPAPEAILRGKLGRPVKGIGGAFVELPDGQRGFLRQPKGLRPGAPVLVQVAGVAEPGKAVPLTDRLLFKGRLAILTPGAPGVNVSRALRDEDSRAALAAAAEAAVAGAPVELGAILRTAAEAADPACVAAEIAELRGAAEEVLGAASGSPALLRAAPGPHEIALRDWPAADTLVEAPDAFVTSGVDGQVAALLEPEVALPGGARMTIEPTRALVAVDVDTGADTTPAAGLKASLAAARQLPRQLRLRGLGGQITVDFAPIPKRDRGTLEQALRAALKRDGAAMTAVGWTPLGHFELQRRRDRAALALLIGGALP